MNVGTAHVATPATIAIATAAATPLGRSATPTATTASVPCTAMHATVATFGRPVAIDELVVDVAPIALEQRTLRPQAA